MAYKHPYKTNMHNKDYWEQRAKENLNKSFGNAKKVERYETKVYKNSLKKLTKDYCDMLSFCTNDDGSIDYSKLNKAITYDRNFTAKMKRLEDEITLMSQQLSERQIKDVTNLLDENYRDTVISNLKPFKKNVSSMALLDTKAVKQAISTPWTTDGREFSGRIWGNNKNMADRLRKTISNGIANGTSTQNMAREFRDIMNNTTYNTQRIIRTETAAVQNRANVDSYKELGAEYVERLDNDAGSCEKCQEWSGNKIKIDDVKVGVNVPPRHPNCRGCILPVIDDDDEIDFNTEKTDTLFDNSNNDTVAYKGNSYNCIERTKEDDAVITSAFNRFTENEQKVLNNYINNVTIADIPPKGAYKCKSKSIIFRPDFTENTAVHEMAHALAEGLDIYNDDRYINIVKNAIPLKSRLFKKSVGVNEYAQSDKFVNKYQGRYYNSKTFTKQFPEYFSVGYETYIFNTQLLKEKDIDLYNYIKGVIRNENE